MESFELFVEVPRGGIGAKQCPKKVECEKGEPCVQIVWNNAFPMVCTGAQFKIYSNQCQAKVADQFGKVSIQKNYAIHAPDVFQMAFDPELDVLLGVITQSPSPLYKGNYWISVFNQNDSGLLQVFAGDSKKRQPIFSSFL